MAHSGHAYGMLFQAVILLLRLRAFPYDGD
jgi:hypothetical protein